MHKQERVNIASKNNVERIYSTNKTYNDDYPISNTNAHTYKYTLAWQS